MTIAADKTTPPRVWMPSKLTRGARSPPGQWTDTIDVRGFIQATYTEYTGDDSFLAGPTDRTTRVWQTLLGMFPQEREKGVYDIDYATPATITSHAPGYISEDDNLIVGLQTDAPLKRAIMPFGGWRMVVKELETYGYPVDPNLETIFSTYRKTHNDGVFDAYPPNVRAARSSHIITGLPDAYGRGRIIGDYRRVALYGVDALIAGQEERARRTRHAAFGRGHHSRPRRELGADQGAGRAQADGCVVWLRHLQASHQHQGSGAVAVLRVPGRGQGAERRRHVAGPHLDLHRLLRGARPRGGHPHGVRGAGNHRRLRHQVAHRPLPAHPRVRRAVLGRPAVGHRVPRGHGRGRAFARDQVHVPLPAHAVQLGPRARAEHDGAVERPTAPGLQGVLRQGLDRHVGRAVRVGRAAPLPVR